MNKIDTLTEIKSFLEGYNSELKYLVNVETDSNTNYGECVIHEPNCAPKIVKITYEPFMYMKDLSKVGLELFSHNRELMPYKMKQYGITITKMKTGNQKRLENGYVYKLTSSISQSSILNFLRDGRVYPFEKKTDDDGNVLKNFKGDPIYLYKDLFYSIKPTEQFMISNRCRLYKGFENYSDIHRAIFDIETTGLRPQSARVFAVGVKDNKGFETILEVEKYNDDESERKLIINTFNFITTLKPAIVAGFNSENFDFEFLLVRAKILGINLDEVNMTLKQGVKIKRKSNTSVKYGNTADKYTATEMWGISVIDILHAVKKTAAVNTELKSNRLKDVAKFEKIAKPNRTYINGEGNAISRFYAENKIFLVNGKNEYVQLPDKHQDIGAKLYKLQANKSRISDEQYKNHKIAYINEDTEFVAWFKENALPNGMITFIGGKKLLRQYLLDDLWETEKVDELYNQSAFMLAKIVPTNFHKITTMGTASIWNLLLTAWSYENDLAIPHCDVKEKFVGGLTRCYKKGFSSYWVKIDYASLYPMIQLTHDVFPIFDITGVIKKMLLYLTTTRNIYKKLANADELNDEEIFILKEIDHETYQRFVNGEITDANRAMFKTKQLPIKILNNSLFGALGSDISFNWSDNVCAGRITCVGRLELRHAIKWFIPYNCNPLLAVTDGVNFAIPKYSNIRISENKGEDVILDNEIPIEEAWVYKGKTGIAALIAKFNAEEMIPPFMSVDNDGEFISCYNLKRINYATLSLSKNKKTGQMEEKIKLTGNSIKSKAMPEYCEDFFDKGLNLILHGKGKEFADYYYDYSDLIRYNQIPLKKIASKSRIKSTLKAYQNRGTDKNGKPKAKQAHMELLLEKRNNLILSIFEEHKSELTLSKSEEKLSLKDKQKLVADFMPPEPELDSIVYFVNTGYKMSDGNSAMVIDKNTGLERYASIIITEDELKDNPNMLGEYNVPRYLAAFNKKVQSILGGFKPEVEKKLLVKIKRKTKKDEFGNKIVTYEPISNKGLFTSSELELGSYDLDSIEESMILEPKEVEFWNKNGYDPRKIWDGFKMLEDDKVYFEVYEHALEFVNEKMKDAGKPVVKSINDKYENGDFILLKSGKIFSLGQYDGTYIKIVREAINVPKTELELEIEKKEAEAEAKIREENERQVDEAIIKKRLEELEEKRTKYYQSFKKKHNIVTDIELSEMMKLEGAEEAFNEFIAEIEEDENSEALEYGEFDIE